MKILLLSYAVIPSFAKAFGNDKATSSAGWVVGIHNLLERAGFEVAIVSPLNVCGEGKVVCSSTTYYAIPANYRDMTELNPMQQELFEGILNDFKPDAVTIFGTEYTQGYAMLLACEKLGILDKSVIFTQGLISMIQRYYIADIPDKIAKHKSLRERFNHMDISSQRASFEYRGINEKRMINKAKHIIGGTVWDKKVINSINPDIKYHYCPETLRNTFYENSWRLDDCQRHSILSVQSGFYPVKGIHYLLEGMSEIVKQYPDSKLYMTVKKPRKAKTFKEKMNANTYENYIAALMDKYSLWENVEFLGNLNEEQLVKQYLSSHVFICASSIENHSQTVSEAKILGVPTIAAFVGGVVERIKHGEDGFLYQHNAPYMISEYASRIFDDDGLALSISSNARRNAAVLVDREKNSERIIEIYKNLN